MKVEFIVYVFITRRVWLTSSLTKSCPNPVLREKLYNAAAGLLSQHGANCCLYLIKNNLNTKVKNFSDQRACGDPIKERNSFTHTQTLLKCLTRNP